MSTFAIKTHNILIIVILSFLSGNSNICVISEYGSDASFVSLDYIFSFVMLCNPPPPPQKTLDILYQLIGTEVVTIRTYVNLGVGMYLLFVVAIDTRDFKFLFCHCFSLLLTLYFSKYSFQSLRFAALSAIIYYYTGALIM